MTIVLKKSAIFNKTAIALMTAALLSACSAMNTDDNVKKETVNQSASAAPTPQSGFRFSDAENEDIANKNRLSYRIFYDKPSTGADAAWFDAVKRGDLATVKYMVQNGQDLEAKDTGSLNQTALGWAAFIGYEDMADYLIAQGASVYATDKGDVYNVMKSAALGKNTNIVKKVHQILKSKGKVDLNDQTVESDGETLIMVAASNNRIETVKYLLSQGANPNLVATTKDKSMGSYNQGAYSYACTRGLIEMQQLLAANGAINHRTGKASCE
ncbi:MULTISPECIES: ankyrin repeat domain-containing protein [Psychrobacter]|uniref:ankyrin repeat domain-containing protein n=1 Tax=Psychrobacter TaxID=497 RepID=UPI001C611F10|nr:MULTISPECIES: ankyrin repeat domain-containing protein [Psychrobacter]